MPGCSRRPRLLGQWVSGAAGTHRNFYNGGQWVYATSTLPGYEGHVLATVDISDESDPMLMAIFPQPRPSAGYDAPSFCAKGGRSGPRNQHQQQGLDCLSPNERYVYLAHFNAGLQIYDISNPRDPYIAGYFIPDDPAERRGPVPSKLVHQAHDVLVDCRGVIYMSEGNSGIYILTHHPSRPR
jgi:hypothetical protein